MLPNIRYLIPDTRGRRLFKMHEKDKQLNNLMLRNFKVVLVERRASSPYIEKSPKA